MPSVDQDDRQVSRRRTGGHVTGVLNVPRSISDNKLTLGGAEVDLNPF